MGKASDLDPNRAVVADTLPESEALVFDSQFRYLGDNGQEPSADQTLAARFPELERILRPWYAKTLAGQTGEWQQILDETVVLHRFQPLAPLQAGLHLVQRWRPGEETLRLLQESEMRSRLLIAGSSAGIWEWQLPTDQLWLSSSFMGLLGFGADEIEPSRDFWRSRSHPDDLPRLQSALSRHLHHNEPFAQESRLRLKSGDYRWFLVTGQAFWNPAGEALRMAGSINDIHSRKRLEQERVLQFDVIFDQAYELMAILSPQGRLQKANRAWLSLLGSTAEDLQDQFFWHLPCWSGQAETTARLRSAVHLAGERQDVRYEETVHSAEGRALQVELSLKPVFGPQQELICLIVEGRDITPLKQAQQLAEKTSHLLLHHNRQLENFAHITSHNLRAPATNIHMLLNYYDSAQNAEERDYALSKLHASSRRLLETLDILSDNLAIRMDPHIPRQQLSFQAVLERTLERLALQIQTSQAEIIADFSLCPSVEYPPSYLDSILLNLLSNALQYRHPDRPPLIRLHTWQEHQRVNLRVSDNGLGINLERHRDKVFGLYKTFHRHPQARGVGLFLIKSQIEALGGRIQLKSQPEQGSTFHIVF